MAKPVDYCAKLTLWDTDQMGKSERAQLAAWLRYQAMSLMKSHDGYSSLFTARYMKPPASLRRRRAS